MSSVTHYQRWFPDFGPYFMNILHTQCAQEYSDYLTRNASAPCNEPNPDSCFNGAVVNCILAAAPPSVNANMAATSVLLGLLPSILLQTGASLPQYTYLIARRPFLGFLLALSTTPVGTVKASDYGSPNTILAQSGSSLPPAKSALQRHVLVVLQYVVAMACVVNVVLILWQFATQTTESWALRFTEGFTIWITISLLLHILSYLALRLRLKISRNPPHGAARRSGLSNVVSYIKQEFTLSGVHMDHTTVRFTAKDESIFLSLLAWLISFVAVIHLIYGTVLLAGILFVSVKDSISIAIRFLASTLFARVILMYELTGMRQTVEYDDRYVHKAKTMPRVQSENDALGGFTGHGRVSDKDLDESGQSVRLVDRKSTT